MLSLLRLGDDGPFVCFMPYTAVLVWGFRCRLPVMSDTSSTGISSTDVSSTDTSSTDNYGPKYNDVLNVSMNTKHVLYFRPKW